MLRIFLASLMIAGAGFDLPRLDHWETNISRSTIRFEVCLGDPLWSASTGAARAWNEALNNRIEIQVNRSMCHASAFPGDGRSQIYYGRIEGVHGDANALYGLSFGSAGIIEEEIVIGYRVEDPIHLQNVITHEMGHALGIADAYHLADRCLETIMTSVGEWKLCLIQPIDVETVLQMIQDANGFSQWWDLNGDAILSDVEFFRGVDGWLRGDIGDFEFFDLVDLWLIKSGKHDQEREFVWYP